MGEGDEDITITATDAAGNTSTTTTKSITVDTVSASLTSETLSAAENGTAVGTIETSEAATVTLGTDADSDMFTLVDGVLTLNSAQDFETDKTELSVAFDLVDEAGNTSSDTLTVNITDVNEAPTASSIADQTAVVDQAFSIDLTSFFNDVDAGDALTYSISGDLPDGITFENGVLSGTATADADTSNITVTATDKAGLSVSTSFDFSVSTPPVITTALSDIGDKMFDVRSDIVLKVNQAVSAVAGKTITLTDNTATGYQGETNTNSFTIDVSSDLVTIDNDNGVIIISVDDHFDLDLSSNYTLSIDTGAFESVDTGLTSGAFTNVSFNTVTPTAGADNIQNLGQIDTDASVANYLDDYLASPAGQGFVNLPVTTQLLLAAGEFAGLSEAEQAPYIALATAAQSWSMNVSTGELEASSEWVDIEGLGVGTTSGTVASLADDVQAGNVFRIDASTADYVFVFSDQNPNGGDENVGAGLETNTDFSVFLDEFGAGDKIYVDDAFNDADNLNVLAFEIFASGNGSESAELYLGLTGGDGDPRLYVGLEGDLESTDEDGNADSSLEGVNNTLGLDIDDSAVITA
jgi:hypothetical protein